MLKRLTTGAVVGLAISLSLAQRVQAGVVNFNSHTDVGTAANRFDEQGLHFEGFQFFFIQAGNPVAVQPLGYDSVFLETALEPLVISLTAGGAFDFQSLRLGLGDFNLGTLDIVTLTGTKAGCVTGCTVSADLQVGPGFKSFTLDGFTGLSSLSIGQQMTLDANGLPMSDIGFLAFDDLSVAAPGVGEPVPEPAAWSLMIAGFVGVGAMIRHRRRSHVLATAT